LGHSVVETASGLRTQKCEIKNKKPTSAECGGGGVESLRVLESVTARRLTHRFCWSARGLNYFPEIKEIKRPSANCSRAGRTFSRRWIRCLGLSPRQIVPGGTLIFGARCVGGWSKVWDLQAGTVWVPRANFRRIPKFFLAPAQGVSNRTNRSRIRSLSGKGWARVLPADKSLAGGSRAKARQRPSSKTSLNRGQLLTRKVNSPPLTRRTWRRRRGTAGLAAR
jgi:hypothetical protein